MQVLGGVSVIHARNALVQRQTRIEAHLMSVSSLAGTYILFIWHTILMRGRGHNQIKMLFLFLRQVCLARLTAQPVHQMHYQN